MKPRLRLLSAALLLLNLFACTSPGITPSSRHEEEKTVVEKQTQDLLRTPVRVSILTEPIRRRLLAARLPHTFVLVNGAVTFPSHELLEGLTSASLQEHLYSRGQLDSDAGEELAAVLQIPLQDRVFSEIAIFSTTGSSLRQKASYVLGEAAVHSITIRGGEVHLDVSVKGPFDPTFRRENIRFTLPSVTEEDEGG